MTDTGNTRDDLKAKAQELTQKLRAELAQRLDQFLDELGALVDGQPDVHPPQQ